jgi:hypothetical protein
MDNFYTYRETRRDEKNKTDRLKIACKCGKVVLNKNLESHKNSRRHQRYLTIPHQRKFLEKKLGVQCVLSSGLSLCRK